LALGLAFIDAEKTVWAGGLGVKDLGKPDPVDADTLFIAASNTKALTTLLLDELADEGKMRWDQPVTELFPAFKLGDEATTNPGAGAASHLRLYGDAAAGLGVGYSSTATRRRLRR
jgi:CubicO group peptidase (beta-lactamase class C family)